MIERVSKLDVAVNCNGLLFCCYHLYVDLGYKITDNRTIVKENKV